MTALERDQQAHCLREERGAANLPRADSVRTADGGRAERERPPSFFKCFLIAAQVRPSRTSHYVPVKARRGSSELPLRSGHRLLCSRCLWTGAGGPGRAGIPRAPRARAWAQAPSPPHVRPLGPRSQQRSPSGGITRIHCPASPTSHALYFPSSCLVLRCGKGGKHKGKSVVAFLDSRQHSAERRLVAKLSREGKSVSLPALIFISTGTLVRQDDL